MDFLVNFFIDYGYLAVLLILLLCGFGLPIPEDITLVSSGIIAGLGFNNVHIMLVVCMFGVLAGDGIMYWLGRIFGIRIIRFRSIKRILTLKRLQSIRKKFNKYGNRLLFIARFLPGLRAPIYMIAGITRRVKFIRFLIIDFLAAIISVPIWVYLGYYGANNLDWLHEQIKHGKTAVHIIIVAIVLFCVFLWLKHRRKTKDALEE